MEQITRREPTTGVFIVHQEGTALSRIIEDLLLLDARSNERQQPSSTQEHNYWIPSKILRADFLFVTEVESACEFLPDSQVKYP